jgi:hypothetical protein
MFFRRKSLSEKKEKQDNAAKDDTTKKNETKSGKEKTEKEKKKKKHQQNGKSEQEKGVPNFSERFSLDDADSHAKPNSALVPPFAEPAFIGGVPVNCFNWLPDEIVAVVLRWLSDEDWFAASLVCKRFAEIFRKQLMYEVPARMKRAFRMPPVWIHSSANRGLCVDKRSETVYIANSMLAASSLPNKGSKSVIKNDDPFSKIYSDMCPVVWVCLDTQNESMALVKKDSFLIIGLDHQIFFSKKTREVPRLFGGYGKYLLLYVDEVQVFSAKDGKLLLEFRIGEELSPSFSKCGMIHKDGRIFIARADEGILVFSKDGVFMKKIYFPSGLLCPLKFSNDKFPIRCLTEAQDEEKILALVEDEPNRTERVQIVCFSSSGEYLWRIICPRLDIPDRIISISKGILLNCPSQGIRYLKYL